MKETMGHGRGSRVSEHAEETPEERLSASTQELVNSMERYNGWLLAQMGARDARMREFAEHLGVVVKKQNKLIELLGSRVTELEGKR